MEVTCAGTGQDGELQMGIPWPDPRLAINGDNTITDNLTGLSWGRSPGSGGSAGGLPWQESLDYVAELNGKGYHGFSDWRLPNRLELASLLSCAEASLPMWLHDRGVADPAVSYWSSSTVASNPASAWGVSATETSPGGWRNCT